MILYLPVLDKNLKKTAKEEYGFTLVIKTIHLPSSITQRAEIVDGPLNFLEGFTGYLQADAFAGYDCIFASKQVKEVACWAHARRYFFDAIKSAPNQANFAITTIKELYKIEREIKD